MKFHNTLKFDHHIKKKIHIFGCFKKILEDLSKKDARVPFPN